MINRLLFLPLSLLGLLLGFGFKTRPGTTPNESLDYDFAWPCGCRAAYHRAHDAREAWQPCDTHLGWAVEH